MTGSVSKSLTRSGSPSVRHERPQLKRGVRRTSGGGIAKAEIYEYDNTYGIEYEKWGTLWTGSI